MADSPLPSLPPQGAPSLPGPMQCPSSVPRTHSCRTGLSPHLPLHRPAPPLRAGREPRTVTPWGRDEELAAFLVCLSPSRWAHPCPAPCPEPGRSLPPTGPGAGGPPHRGPARKEMRFLRIRNCREEPASESQGPETGVLTPFRPDALRLPEAWASAAPSAARRSAHLSPSESLEISSFILPPPLDLPLSRAESAWEVHDPPCGQGSGHAGTDPAGTDRGPFRAPELWGGKGLGPRSVRGHPGLGGRREGRS